MGVKIDAEQTLNLISILAPAIMGLNPETAKYADLVTAGLMVAEISQKPSIDKKELGKAVAVLGAETANKIKPGSVNSDKVAAIYDNSVDLVIAAVNAFVRKNNSVSDSKKEIDPFALPAGQ